MTQESTQRGRFSASRVWHAIFLCKFFCALNWVEFAPLLTMGQLFGKTEQFATNWGQISKIR